MIWILVCYGFFVIQRFGLVNPLVVPSTEDKALLDKQCGPQLALHLKEYASFHDKVVKRLEPARYLVSIGVEAGLADRLFGIVSQFWLAFFSKRAFQIAPYDKLPSFEFAYDYRFINWTRHVQDPAELTAPLYLTYKGIRDYQGHRAYNPSIIDTKRFFMDYLINNAHRTHHIFHRTNVSEYPDPASVYPKEHTVYSSSNRVALHDLFSNPYMQRRLEELGVTTMSGYRLFRCGYHFLFSENSAVMKVVQPPLQALLQPTTNTAVRCKTKEGIPLVVGIGLRIGDRVFEQHEHADSAQDSLLRPYLHIAEAVQRQFYLEHQCQPAVWTTDVQKLVVNEANQSPFPWFAMADSLSARVSLYRSLHDRVVVNNHTVYFHGDCAFHTEGGCGEAALRHAIVHAVAQLYIYRQCTVQISTFGSGFPVVGGMLADHLLLPISFREDDKKCWYPKKMAEDIMWRMEQYKGKDSVLAACSSYDMHMG